MIDLIERLRHPYPEIAGLAADEAADRIEALTAENERLRDALERDAVRFEYCAQMIGQGFAICGTLRAEHRIKAEHYALETRAALEAKP